MLVNKHIKKSTDTVMFYWDRVDFKKGFCYTDHIQLTTKNPWWVPRYEDNFAGIEGLRLYGWLFFYFGRYYTGLIFPAIKGENEGGLLDKTGKRWFFMSKKKVDDFYHCIYMLRKRKSKDHVEFQRVYTGSGYAVKATYTKVK